MSPENIPSIAFRRRAALTDKFVSDVSRAAGLRWHESTLGVREPIVAQVRGAYDDVVTSISVEFRGSPPRFLVFVPCGRQFVVERDKVCRGLRTIERVAGLVERFAADLERVNDP